MVSRLSFDCIGKKRLSFYDSLFLGSFSIVSFTIHRLVPDNFLYKFFSSLYDFNEV